MPLLHGHWHYTQLSNDPVSDLFIILYTTTCHLDTVTQKSGFDVNLNKTTLNYGRPTSCVVVNGADNHCGNSHLLFTPNHEVMTRKLSHINNKGSGQWSFQGGTPGWYLFIRCFNERMSTCYLWSLKDKGNSLRITSYYKDRFVDFLNVCNHRLKWFYRFTLQKSDSVKECSLFCVIYITRSQLGHLRCCSLGVRNAYPSNLKPVAFSFNSSVNKYRWDD